MQLRYEQLTPHLQKQLAPIYLISGDVPLLMQEACDAIRAAVRKQEYLDRQVFYVESNFAWQNLLNAANSGSLFSHKQLLELRIAGNSLGEAGSKALQTYMSRLPIDKILLIAIGKLEASAQRANWFQTLLKIGVVVQLWPIEKAQLPRWIAERLASVGLKAEAAGVQLLADYAEGNLLAAQQEIEKLRLIYSAGLVKTEDIAAAISDNARFDVFTLTDTMLQGDGKRVLRIFGGLKEEGVDPVLILWALARELRSLVASAYALTCGTALEKILQEQRVWEKRKPLVRAALQRHSLIKLRHFLQQASVIDRIIKGLEPGNVWDGLMDLGLGVASG
jgi:DNA polymerase-3 subunit delta